MAYKDGCPDCGLPGKIDLGFVIFDCGTIYKLERWPDGGTLYGPKGGRTPECYEQQIQNLQSQVRLLTEKLANALKMAHADGREKEGGDG